MKKLLQFGLFCLLPAISWADDVPPTLKELQAQLQMVRAQQQALEAQFQQARALLCSTPLQLAPLQQQESDLRRQIKIAEEKKQIEDATQIPPTSTAEVP